MNLANATVAVTGATGFIGRYIVRALRARGAHVVGVVRNPGRVPALAEGGVELRQADLSDGAALTAGFTGCDAVISNAGLISIGRQTPERLIEANVVGTGNVLRAMRDAGVARAIQTSSATVYRPKRGHFYCEDDPLHGEGDSRTRFSAYAVSKACAEAAAWRLANDYQIGLSTGRPPSVHGAFDGGSFTLWLKRLMALPVSVWPTNMLLSSVYAGDIAEAMCLMLETPSSIGRAYNIAGPTVAHSYWDLMEAWRLAGGASPALIVPIPVPVRRQYSIARAEQDLGWRNRPLVAGFREMLALENGACD